MDSYLGIGQSEAAQRPVKFYILDGIKNHAIFKEVRFWEACLLYQMTSNREDFDFHNERFSIDISLVTENYVSKITKTFMGIALHMKDVSMSTNTVIEILTKYARKYRIPPESFQELQSFLDMTFGTECDAKLMSSGLSTASKVDNSPSDATSSKRKDAPSFFLGGKIKGVFGSLVQNREKSEQDYFNKRVFSIHVAPQADTFDEADKKSNPNMSKS